MSQTKIILFNGPPRSGKDTATQFALDCINGWGSMPFGIMGFTYRMASPLKDAVHAMFGMPRIPEEHFDGVKDAAQDCFMGMSPREAYIWISEEVVKPKFGRDFWSKIAVNRIRGIFGDKSDTVVVISDCGFQEEVNILIDAFSADSISVVHMYRYGCSFFGDSRNYVKHPNDKERVFGVWNSGTKEDLKEEIYQLVGSIINGTPREQ